MDIAGLLHLLKAEPTLLPEAPRDADGADIEQRREQGTHTCLCCGQRATTACLVEHEEQGKRWLDLCMPHFTELRRQS